MKRSFLVLLLCMLIATGVSAQSSDMTFSELQSGFESFADGVASTLGSAAMTGLNWSTAYVGQLPHFGVGLTAGAALIPYANMETALQTFGVTLPSEVSFIEDYGIPLPAAVVDARLGGFFLPFDIGFKIGFLPDQVKALIPGVTVDYLAIGGDFRYALLDGKGLWPAVSVGVGYSYYKGSIGIPGLMGSDLMSMDISSVMQALGYLGTHTLTMTDPELVFDWQSSVFEAKVQASKTLLFITPSIGIKAAYAISTAGGGITSDLVYSGSSDLATVALALSEAGYPVPTSTGITVSSSANGWAFCAFGGVDIALLIIHLDASINYNLVSGSLGGSLNLRLQI